MFLSIVHGIILSITGILIMPSFLKLFTNNQDTLSLGLRYSNIVLLFSIIIHVEITFEKYFQAMGMMVVSMLSMLCGCILNIILDPVLIFWNWTVSTTWNRRSRYRNRHRPVFYLTYLHFVLYI